VEKTKGAPENVCCPAWLQFPHCCSGALVGLVPGEIAIKEAVAAASVGDQRFFFEFKMTFPQKQTWRQRLESKQLI
jgi:hypothetical protein